MIFGYEAAPINLPREIVTNMDAYLNMKYSDYTRAVENLSTNTITLYSQNGDNVLYPSNELADEDSKHYSVMNELTKSIAASGGENTIIFEDILSLGSDDLEAASIYVNMIRHGIHVEIIRYPAVNTRIFEMYIKRMPVQAEISLGIMFREAYCTVKKFKNDSKAKNSSGKSAKSGKSKIIAVRTIDKQ